jgi:hypothetical protein
MKEELSDWNLFLKGLDSETIAKLEEEILNDRETQSEESVTSLTKSRLPADFFDEPQKKSTSSTITNKSTSSSTPKLQTTTNQNETNSTQDK